MHESTRAFFKRGGTACAAAVLVLSATFGAAPMAHAAPAEPPATTAPATNAASDGALPDGLEEALERDLDLTRAQFDGAGELAQKALDAEAAVEAAGVKAQVSLKDGAIKVHTATADVDARAAGEKLSKELGVNVELSVKSNDIQRKYASSLDMLAADYLASASEEDLAELQSIGWTGDEYIIHTGALSTEKPSPQRRSADISSTLSATDFASRYANVSVESADGPAVASAEEVVNGQGYGRDVGDDSTALCSIGWSAFNAAGDPAVISAGHCTHDGSYDDVVLTDPVADQDGTVDLGSDLGTFGFSQFGGENNSPVTGYDARDSTNAVGNFGTDISVVDDINPDLNLLPQVADWKNVADLTSSGPRVTGVSTAVLGAPICKSGRTTGWTCGEVDEITLFLVAGIDIDNDPNDVRGVKGFGSYRALNAGGDSGGAVISGTLAVGITSASGKSNDREMAYSADLKDALAYTDGYTVELAVNTPALDAPQNNTPQNNGDVEIGKIISGTVDGKLAPASSVVVTMDGTATTVPVTNSKWSFNAPSTPGEFTFTVQGKNGFSTSTTETYTLVAIRAVPAISTPKDGVSLTHFVTSLSGTGMVGATVKLTGDVTGEVRVSDDGTWTYELDDALRYGEYSVTAVQSLDGSSSDAASSSFKVVPAKPVITSPENGHEFSFAEGGPATVAGTGINGASVLVTINGNIELPATVKEGAWNVEVPSKFDTGTHNITATQTVSEMTSGTANVSITVLAAPEPEPTEPPTTPSSEPTKAPTTSAPGDVSTPASAPANNGNDAAEPKELPKTGSSNIMMSIGAAGGVVLLAGIGFMLFRRRDLEG